MARDYYHSKPKRKAARIGQYIYHEALHRRRGFRDDQMGIPTDDEVWEEIFQDIGERALEAVK